MEEDKLWKIMARNTWNVALNVKIEMKLLWTPKPWLWMPMGGMTLKAYEKGDSERQCEKVVALNA